ncbi:hypothetical protein Hdeb2414_s0010g00348111 [Helianthus debilis subsp. tardiflorus]
MGSGNRNRPAARITIEDDHCVLLEMKTHITFQTKRLPAMMWLVISDQ